MSIKPLVVAFALSVMIVGAGRAVAQTPSGDAKATSSEIRGRLAACQKDFDALCATVERGKGRRLLCLKENEVKLTPGCKTAVDAVLATRAARQATSGGAAKQQ